MAKAKRMMKPEVLIGRLSDEEVARLIELKEKVKELTARVKAFEDRCKSVGTFSTRSYVVTVTTTETERLAGKKELIDGLGFETIKPYLKQGTSTSVKAARKGE